MLKKLVVLAIFIPFLTSLTSVTADEQVRNAEIPTQIVSIQAGELDPRAVVLKDYLAKYSSPLQNNAQDFVDAADEYNLDWKLVPAIAGNESTFGKFIPGGHDPATISYNGWGWGVYGDQSLAFSSWREAIFTVSEGLRKDYLNRGLTEPYSIGKKYAASPNWAKNVSYFLNDMEEFSKNHRAKGLIVAVDNKGDITKLKQVLTLKETITVATGSSALIIEAPLKVDELALSN